MAVQTVAQLRQWFMTGLKPLQQQFWDWLDSYRHVSTKIVLDDLSDDLKAVINSFSGGAVKVILTNAGAATYTMPAGSWLQGILFLDESNPAISVGTTDGGDEVYDNQQLNNGWAISAGYDYFKTATTIYFSGATGTTTIKILYV